MVESTWRRELLLGRGALGATRILKSSTVKLMATDQLDPRITRRFFLPEKGAVGFGLDFAVRTAQPQTATENRGTVGEFFWDEAETTLFSVDPANDIPVRWATERDPTPNKRSGWQNRGLALERRDNDLAASRTFPFPTCRGFPCELR